MPVAMILPKQVSPSRWTSKRVCPSWKTPLLTVPHKKKELEGFIAALQAKKREMQQQLQDWRAAQQSTGAGKAASSSDLNRIARDAEKSGNAFDRVMGRQNAVHSSTDAAQLAKLKELEDLSRNNRIAERLASLKGGEIR